MFARILSALLALSVFVPSAALAEWDRNDGFRKKPKAGSSYDGDYEKDSKKKGSGEDEAAPSDAEEESESEDDDGAAGGAGFAVGARLGFALPFGKLAAGEASEGEMSPELKELVSGGFPAQLDVGYFINSRLYVGGFFQYGVMLFGDECDGGSCSASQLRFGLNAAYSFKPEGKMNPWVGLGVGYEMLNVNVSAAVGDVTLEVKESLRGFEFANLQGGLDFRVGKSVWVGPYANFTVGQYSRVSIDLGDLGDIGGGEEGALSGDIPDKAFHFWLMGGVRVLFRI